METTFARVIEDHLELKRRNSSLDGAMPIGRYRVDDPFENHPLFKTEEQARLEDTMSGEDAFPTDPDALTWPGNGEPEPAAETEDGLWSRSRDFDWGE